MRNIIFIAIFLLVAVGFISESFVAKKGGGGGKITYLDDFPRRTAGDSSVVSGSWTIPYNDAVAHTRHYAKC